MRERLRSHRLFRRVARPVFRALFRILTRAEIRGLEHAPPGGPLLIAFNHLGHLDPPLVLAHLPTLPEIVALADLVSIPAVAWLVRGYGVIHVHRDEFDRAVVERAVDVLQSGGMLALAPEARQSRSGGLERARTGAAYLAVKANAPVLPVALTGTENHKVIAAWRARRRPRLTLTIGPPFSLGAVPLAGPQRKAALREAADEIMRHIAALLPQPYRGVYG